MAQLSLGASIKPELKFIEDKRLVRPEQLGFLSQMILQSKEMVIDYEADGLNIRAGHRPFMAGFFTPETGAKVLDLRLVPEGYELLRTVLPKRTGTTIGHNFQSAEVAMSRALGFELGGKLWDNQHAIFAIDERLDRGQKEYAEQTLKKRPIYAHALRDWMAANLGTHKQGHELNPLELEVPYNAEDVEQAWDIYLDTRAKAERYGMVQLIETDSELTRCIAEMESTGLRLDIEAGKTLLARFTDEIDRCSKELYSLCGRTIDVENHQALFGLMYGELRFPMHEDIEKAGKLDDDCFNWFLTQDALEEPSKRHRIVEVVVELKEYLKLRGTYLYPWLYEHQIDGVLFPHLNLNGARTRRLSCEKPNLQNIPVRTALGRSLRDLVLAEEGGVEYSMDYSQIEYRAFAHYCAEPWLVKAYRENAALDMHQRISDQMHVDRDTVGKHMNFAMLFRVGKAKLARKLGVDQGISDGYINDYHKMLPALKPWMRKLEAEVKRDGYVKDSVFGGRRHLKENEAYTAVNSACQMTAADLIRNAMTRMYPLIKRAGGKVRLQIHDEVKFHLPGARQDHIGTLTGLRDAMQDYPQFRVPVYTSIEYYTTNWNQLAKWKTFPAL